MQTAAITKEIASKVLEVVDAGLSSGVGERKPGFMCVEAAVCYALGLPHGDDPRCVSPALRSLKITLNDKPWSSKEARAKGLRRLAVAQLGSVGVLDDREFAKRVAEMVIRKMVPLALRAAASIQKDAAHKQKLIDAANRCEKDGTKAAANAASAYAAASAAASAYAAASAAASASASDAASAYAAASAAASAYAAASAAYAAKSKARDQVLSDFAEGVVQILIEMKAPGCEWLSLTEAA
jgi:hypothetical protein